MNSDTRVIVCCYEGDGHQVAEALEFYLHHGCPITVLSPVDAKVAIDHPNVTNLYGGKAAYIGQDSLDRQAVHLAMCLDFPEKFFLLHDADSILLTPEIPKHLYEKPDVVWSNQVFDDIPEHQSTFEEGWPHVAFQPPYFLSRETIGKMLAVMDDPRVKASPVMPFIDYYMVQLTMVAGLEWSKLPDSISCPISCDLRKLHITARDKETYGLGMQIAREAVNRGVVFLHSVKNHVAIRQLMALREAYATGNPYHEPRITSQHVGGTPQQRRARGRTGGPPQTGLRA